MLSLNFNSETFIRYLMLVIVTTPGISIAQEAMQSERPKLILQITVDQLRGDLPFRFQARFSDHGFNYLLKQGTVYRDAHHAHANTETIVGHVTLATGAHPATHGLIGNIWLNRDTGETIYNIEDSKFKLLTAGADIDKSVEIDLTQKVAKTEGRSPNNILVSTFSDEMAIASAGLAKIYSVSIKDRGAVSMAGHAGKAFWFSKASSEFVSSNYYYQQYPQWVKDWNAEKFPDQYANTEWTLMHEQSTYLFGESDDNPWEFNLAEYGITFPHHFGDLASPYYSTLLTVSPIGDELTAQFAKALIVNESLGEDNVTDYLAISFSSTDYIGHFFGLSSLESEENLLRLDNTLADLFSFINERIGLENTVIVLSADHGGPEVPGFLTKLGINTNYVNPVDWDNTDSISILKEKLNIQDKLILGYYHPYIYLNHDIIKQKKLSLTYIQDEVSMRINHMEGIFKTIVSHKLEDASVPDTPLYKAVLNNYNAKRSGDIYVIFNPHVFINNLDGLVVAAVHGSPWNYDTFVPIIFAGSGIPAQQIYRKVSTVDVAPTLSALLKIKPPSGSAGNILHDVLK